jgi:hypothetical protein
MVGAAVQGQNGLTGWRAISRNARLLYPTKLPRRPFAIEAVEGRLCCKSRFALMIKNCAGYGRGFRVEM